MAKEEIKEEVKSTKKAYEKTQLVTQTSPAILDVKTGEAMTIEDAIVELLNKVDKIERAVA